MQPCAPFATVGLWTFPCVSVVVISLGILHAEDALTLLWLGSLVNVALSLLKAALAQVTVNNKALMADALHGLGDTAAQVVAALAYGEAARPPDKEHPWGHGKIESIGALVVAAILLYAAASIGWDSASSLYQMLPSRQGASAEDKKSCQEDRAPSATAEPLPAVSPWQQGSHESSAGLGSGRAAIAVGLASIALKEALFRATLHVGESAESRLAVATAWQHRSDSLSAGVALLSQLGACYGQNYLDAVGGSVVASMLAHSACGSVMESLDDLLDYNHASEIDGAGTCGREALSNSIRVVPGVRNHTLRTRRMGTFCLVDVTIVVDARISASAASMVAEAVHNRVIDDFHPVVTDVVVHVDPDGTPQSHSLDTHAEMQQARTGGREATRVALGHEAVEKRVREALVSLVRVRPDVPEILEVTELQTYYSDLAMGNAGPFVDVKVDLRLPFDGTSLRDAQRTARAARQVVLAALPGVVREVDIDLELDEASSEEDSCEQKRSAT